LTVTALGIVTPGAQFSDDAFGLAWPVGQMVRNEAADVPVAVVFSTTESASTGTPARPPTATSRDSPPVHGVEYAPTLDAGRESRMRPGLMAWNSLPVPDW
jgi:hypothetical protein